jgi:hypothetical protein
MTGCKYVKGQPGARSSRLRWQGPGKSPTTLGLVYTSFPCISAIGCFLDLNPWPHGHKDDASMLLGNILISIISPNSGTGNWLAWIEEPPSLFQTRKCVQHSSSPMLLGSLINASLDIGTLIFYLCCTQPDAAVAYKVQTVCFILMLSDINWKTFAWKGNITLFFLSE